MCVSGLSLAWQVMIKALNTNLHSTIGKGLDFFLPKKPLEYSEDRMPLEPAAAKDRPLFKGAPKLQNDSKAMNQSPMLPQGCGSRKGGREGLQGPGLEDKNTLRG